jgi:hypothetical protein
MTDDEELRQELTGAAAAIGALARDEDTFRAAVDAFRAADRDSFQRLLAELKIADRCGLVCEWIRSKECVLLCLELAGPPPEREVADLRRFAETVVRITGDEELVERLAGAVANRDPAAVPRGVRSGRRGGSAAGGRAGRRRAGGRHAACRPDCVRRGRKGCAGRPV